MVSVRRVEDNVVNVGQQLTEAECHVVAREDRLVQIRDEL